MIYQEYFEFGDELLKKVSSGQTERKLSTKKANVGGTKLEIREGPKLWNMFNDIMQNMNELKQELFILRQTRQDDLKKLQNMEKVVTELTKISSVNKINPKMKK